MTFNINDFKSAVQNHGGLARNNKYRVMIPIPVVLLSSQDSEKTTATVRDIEYFADSARAPGIAMSVHPALRYGYGSVERKPFSPLFTDITFTFLCDGKGDIRRYFTRWMKGINNFDLREGITTEKFGNQGTYELSYKQEYMVDLSVESYNDAGEVTNKVILREAYPIFVGELGYNWVDPNFSRLPVTFTMIDWYEEEVNNGTANNTTSTS